MKSTVFATAVALAVLGQNALAAPKSLDAPRYMAQRDWKAYQGRAVAAMPSSDIAGLVYLGTGATVPSCGLLVEGTIEPAFIEIISAKPGQEFPQCVGITGAAMFNLGKKNYLAVEFLNRTAKDKTYRQYAYLVKDLTGRYTVDRPLSALGAQTVAVAPKAKASASTIGEGVALARAEYVRKSYPNLQMLQNHMISDPGSMFAVLTNKAAATCTFLIDAGPLRATFTQEYFYRGQKCVEFVESSKFDVKGKVYYFALYTDKNKNAATAIFSVDQDNTIIAETELAAAAFNEGEKADIKLIKRFLVNTVTPP